MASSALSTIALVIVGVFTLVGVVTFILGITRLVGVITAGAPESGRWDPLGKRIWTAFRITLLHTSFKNRPVVRIAHWLVMVSFVLLLLTLASSYGQLFDTSFSLPLLGDAIWWAWLTELFALSGLVSILTLTAIRLVIMARSKSAPRSSRFFGSTRWQAWFVEAVIGAVCLSILVLHALNYALESNLGEVSWANYPLTSWAGSLLVDASPTALANAIVVVASLKICVSMLWMFVVGTDVAMGISWHRFLAPVNITAGSNPDGKDSLGALSLPLISGDPSANLEEAADEDEDLVIGLGTTNDLTWKDRLDVLSCTECGRCQDMCPAWNTEKPLSPKLLTLALRDNVVSASGALPPLQHQPHTGDVLGALAAAKMTESSGVAAGVATLVPDVVSAEALWDCTMCGACVEQCPVDIEHIDRISNLRRFQFLMESAFPRELAKPMRSLETKGNPYNQMPRKRLDWAKNLDFEFPIIGEDVDDASGLDYLFWVGCAGAYDERAKKTTAAVAELLHVADVKFGVLGSAESCTGDPARRAGNEVLFQVLAKAAIETLQDAKARRIVVTCAHCFNTIQNEFPQLGAHFEVLHHTQLLNQLLRDGLLKPAPAADSEKQKITYHDPCFLGRHNRVFEAPRELLANLPNLETVEMVQNREQAMCCGAGGARAWMEETRGTRIASSRMEQAQSTGAQTVATACPFCTQMLGSAPTSVLDKNSAKFTNAADTGSSSESESSEVKPVAIEIKDVAVLLLEGVRRAQQGNHPHQ